MEKSQVQVLVLKDVLCELQSLHIYDVFNLGIQLGLHHSQLRIIERQFPCDVSRQLTEVIIAWEKSDCCFSWRKLGKALMNVADHINQGKYILKKYVKEYDVIVKEFDSNKNATDLIKRPRVIKLKDRSGGDKDICVSINVSQSVYNPNDGHNGINISPFVTLPPSPSPPPPPPSSAINYSTINIPYTNFPSIDVTQSPPSPPPPPPPPLLLPITNSIDSSNNQEITKQPTAATANTMCHAPRDDSSLTLPLTHSPSMASISSQSSVIVLPTNERLPTNHPLLPVQNQTTRSIKETNNTRQMIIRLKQKFAHLWMKTADLIKEAKVEVSDIKRFLKFALCGPESINFLEGHFEELDSKENIDDILLFLKQFTSYEDPGIIQILVYEYVEESGGQLMKKYIEELKEFEDCCSCQVYASARTELVEERYMQSYSPDTVTVHLNDTWANRSVVDLRSFRKREFSRVPEFAFKRIKMENRSILVVWQTTEIVVRELTKNFIKRFVHLRSQGVDQIIVGEYEIDFTLFDKPELYKIQILEPPSRLLRSVSSQTLESTVSASTQKSAESEDTGFVSGTTSVSSIYATITESQFQYGVINSNFISDTLYLSKGDKVTIVASRDNLILIKTNQDKYGYIPHTLLKKSSIASKAPPVPIPLSQVIIRKMIQSFATSSKQQNTSSTHQNTVEENEIIPRPDTPPADAINEGETIILSDKLNSRPSNLFSPTSSSKVTFSSTKPNYLSALVDDSYTDYSTDSDTLASLDHSPEPADSSIREGNWLKRFWKSIWTPRERDTSETVSQNKSMKSGSIQTVETTKTETISSTKKTLEHSKLRKTRSEKDMHIYTPFELPSIGNSSVSYV